MYPLFTHLILVKKLFFNGNPCNHKNQKFKLGKSVVFLILGISNFEVRQTYDTHI